MNEACVLQSAPCSYLRAASRKRGARSAQDRWTDGSVSCILARHLTHGFVRRGIEVWEEKSIEQ